MDRQTFTIGRKTATLYPSGQKDRPLIVLNTFTGDGSSVVEAMKQIDTPDCSLLVVGELNWDHDMTPWYCPPLSENDTPCTGGAEEYLTLLTEQILPEARKRIAGTPSFTGIAGYSLGGLFALYAAYHCDEFRRVASMSGSLWFPDFREYVLSHDFANRPDRIYLSLGDKEAKTRNPVLKTVQDNTEAVAEHYEKMGIHVIRERNPGNHFKDPALRSAKGIRALLD